jgi:uncharacterized RDD family membrane protein YckC
VELLPDRGRRPEAVTPLSARLGSATFAFTAAPLRLRLAAGALDLLLLAVALGGALRFCQAHVPGGLDGLALAPLALAGALLYLTAAFGFRGQTVGQWYFGLMVATKDGHEIWLGRAFFLALATLATGWSLPVALLLFQSKRSLADWLCGVRTIRDRVTETTE